MLGGNNMSKIQEVATAVERGKSKKVAGLVQEALDSGASAPSYNSSFQYSYIMKK